MDREPLSNDRQAQGDLDVSVDDLLECYRADRGDNTQNDCDIRLAPLLAKLSQDHVLSERAERISSCDRTIQSAFADVPVPPGLLENVMASLQASQSDIATGVSSIVPVKVSIATVKLPAESQVQPNRSKKSKPQTWPRRAFLALAGTAAAAAAIAIGVLCMHHPRQETPSSLLNKGIAHYIHDKAGHPQGALFADSAPPADLPFSKDLLPLRGIRWRNVDDSSGGEFAGSGAVAYDLPSLNGTRATLYVFHGNVPGLLPFAPAVPSGNTGGCSAGAWQVGSTLYVLVVEGNDRAYQQYLDMSHGPIA
jgi:hypothetical protein